MGLRDYFRKKNDDEGSPRNPTDPIFSISFEDLAYAKAIGAANQMMADQAEAGGLQDMSAEMRAWFVAHAGEAVNPTEAFGVTWYAHQDGGRMQLVDHGMLEMTDMHIPANQPGIQLMVASSGTTGSPEVLARKDRSEAELRQHGVPINEALPVIEGSPEVQGRTSVEVAQRAVCLMAVAIKAEVTNEGGVAEFQPTLHDIIATYQIENVLTPNERAFVNNMAPDIHTATQFAWRYEGLATLLWALGFVDTLAYPAAICDVPGSVGIVRNLDPEGFFAAAELRPMGELLDAADFIYRMHWAVRNASLGSSPPVSGVDAGVVMERHHTLNWLIGYQGQDWDNVSTDT